MAKDVVIGEMLIDFSKMSLGKDDKLHKLKGSKEAMHLQTGFIYLYDDIQRFLGDAMQRVESENKVECDVLCLKMISEIMKTQRAIYKLKTGKSGIEHEFEGVGSDGLSLYVNALINVEN